MRLFIVTAIFFCSCNDNGEPGALPDATSSYAAAGDRRIDGEVSNPDATPGAGAGCETNPEQAESCFDGMDNDCDGLTDQEGGDPDCDGFCQPASGGCTDSDPTTEDYCSPLDWRCKNQPKQE